MDIIIDQIDVILLLVAAGWRGGVSLVLIVATNVFKWLAPAVWTKLPEYVKVAMPLILAAGGSIVAIWAGVAAQTVIPFAAAVAGFAFVNHKVLKAVAKAIDRKWGSKGNPDYQPGKISRGLSLVTHVSVDENGNLKPPAVGSARMGRQ